MLGTSKEEFERLLPQFEKVFIETKLSNPSRKHKLGQSILQSQKVRQSNLVNGKMTIYLFKNMVGFRL